MTQKAAAAEATTPENARPDIATMRNAINRLLDPEAVPDAPPILADELDTLTLQLRGHLDLLMPEVEEAAQRLPKDNIPRYCALACLGEARGKLRAQPSPTSHGPIAYARRLARVLNALCDHYEALSGHA